MGFEPTVGYKPTPIFKTGAINQLDHLSVCHFSMTIYILSYIMCNCQDLIHIFFYFFVFIDYVYRFIFFLFGFYIFRYKVIYLDNKNVLNLILRRFIAICIINTICYFINSKILSKSSLVEY